MRPFFPGVKVKVSSNKRCAVHDCDPDRVYTILTVKISWSLRPEMASSYYATVSVEGYDRVINTACLEIVDGDTNIHKSN
jgi:hypothetical protein